MKKILLVGLAVFGLLFTPSADVRTPSSSIAFAGSGSRLMYDTQTLISEETGTATGDAVDLNAAYKDFTIDVVTLATGTVTVRIDGNAAGDDAFDSTGLGDSITCTALKCTRVYNSQPMVQLRAVITSAIGTNSTTVTVTAVQ